MFHLYECFLRCVAVYNYVIFFAGKFKPVIKKAMVELEGIFSLGEMLFVHQYQTPKFNYFLNG